MDFDLKYKDNMEVAFPSKMAEYARIGLPILINAPVYASIVKWARNPLIPDFAEVVSTENEEEIEALDFDV